MRDDISHTLGTPEGPRACTGQNRSALCAHQLLAEGCLAAGGYESAGRGLVKIIQSLNARVVMHRIGKSTLHHHNASC
jgi:hypothetical protein